METIVSIIVINVISCIVSLIIGVNVLGLDPDLVYMLQLHGMMMD